MTHSKQHNPDTIAELVGGVGEHLAKIYLGNNNPRRQEFVGRLEEMVRAQLKKEQFAMMHDVPVDNVMYASEVFKDHRGTDKPMSPMRVKDSVSEGFFKDSKAMEEEYDITVESPEPKNDEPMSNEEEILSIVSPQSDYELTTIPGGGCIVASDLSQFEISFDNLQYRISQWAEETFGDTELHHKFERMTDEMDEILMSPSDTTEWSDLLMIFMHAAKTQDISMTEVLEAGYNKLDVLKLRVYRFDDDDQKWVYESPQGVSL